MKKNFHFQSVSTPLSLSPISKKLPLILHIFYICKFITFGLLLSSFPHHHLLLWHLQTTLGRRAVEAKLGVHLQRQIPNFLFVFFVLFAPKQTSEEKTWQLCEIAKEKPKNLTISPLKNGFFDLRNFLLEVRLFFSQVAKII